jgi:hypothetical protein
MNTSLYQSQIFLIYLLFGTIGSHISESAECIQIRFPGERKQTAAEMVGSGGALAAVPRHHLVLLLLCFLAGGARASPTTDALRRAPPLAAGGGLCQQLLLPQGYPCTEHTVRTSFLLPVLDFFFFFLSLAAED